MHQTFVKTLAKSFTEALESSFWNRVQKTDTCWLWKGAVNHKGYGYVESHLRKPRFFKAHRFSYLCTHGSIPDDLFVLHHCDNPTCVRPDHLYVGTHLDNMKDRRERGGSKNQGELHPRCKLSDELIREIRQLHKQGLSQKELLEKYPIQKTQMSRIVNHEAWGHV